MWKLSTLLLSVLLAISSGKIFLIKTKEKRKKNSKVKVVAVRTNGEQVKLNLIFYFKYPFYKNVKDIQHFCG